MIPVKKYFLFIATLLVAIPASRAQFSKATILLSGTVTSAESSGPLKAKISFMDPSGKEANTAITNASGRFQAVLKPGMQYTVNIVCSQYYTDNESLHTPDVDSYQEQTQNFALQPIKAGSTLFDQDCFDQGSVTPRGDAASAIAAIGAKMKLNDEMEVSIETFSDPETDGDAAAPADQGTQRANAIKTILLSNGAPANRITENPHNPPPAVQEEETSSKKKKAKKKKVVKKKIVKKKKYKKGKQVAEAPPAVKATITITKVHSEDE